MASHAQLAKRAFVKVLLALAASYRLLLHFNRDSADAAVSAAYRRVIKRVHPDKGGAVADTQRLQTAKEAWDAGRLGSAGGRCPQEAPSQTSVVEAAEPDQAATALAPKHAPRPQQSIDCQTRRNSPTSRSTLRRSWRSVCLWVLGFGLRFWRGKGGGGSTVAGRKFFLFCFIAEKYVSRFPLPPLIIPVWGEW